MSSRDTAPASLVHPVLKSPIGHSPNENEGLIVFALGCFWGAERAFWTQTGVSSTAVGYIGGESAAPTYDAVCSGTTGHAEAVRVVYRPTEIDVGTLLRIFWEAHDPTQGDRQGNDRGSQYRSGIYASSSAQLEEALSSRDRYQNALAQNQRDPITTEILMAPPFWFAEEYHQQYLHKNPGGYCGLLGCGVNFPS